MPTSLLTSTKSRKKSLATSKQFVDVPVEALFRSVDVVAGGVSGDVYTETEVDDLLEAQREDLMLMFGAINLIGGLNASSPASESLGGLNATADRHQIQLGTLDARGVS